MTERQGLFTVQTSLLLSPEHRMRLEHLVREQHSDPADVVTRIVAERALENLPVSGDVSGDAIHVRFYLTPEQRAAFERHLAEHEIHLPILISRIVTEYLAELPPAPPAPEPPQHPRAAEIAKRRADLARLRARRAAAGKDAPAWLYAYIAQMEAELRQMEQAT